MSSPILPHSPRHLPFYAEPPCEFCGEQAGELLDCEQCARGACARCWEYSPHGRAWNALAEREQDRYNAGDMPPILCPRCSAVKVAR